MSKRFAMLLAVVAAVALLGVTGCSHKKMMMSSETPVQSQHIG